MESFQAVARRIRHDGDMCFLLEELNNHHHLYTVCELVPNCNKEKCKHCPISGGISIQITCLSISSPDTVFQFVYSIIFKWFVSSFLHPSSIPASLDCFQSCQSEDFISTGQSHSRRAFRVMLTKNERHILMGSADGFFHMMYIILKGEPIFVFPRYLY